jgi:ankyrin repeat protein
MYKLKYSKYTSKLKQIGSASYTPEEDRLLTLLERCAQNGLVNEIQPVLNLNKTFRNYVQIWYYPSITQKRLEYAVRTNDIDRCRYLIQECKTNPNFRGINYTGYPEYTLLTFAIHNRREVIRFLLDNGADPNYLQADGKSPLYFAIFNHQQIDIIQLLLDKGANKNYIHNGYSLLFLALYQRLINVAEVLIRNNVNINFLYGGRSALQYILLRHNVDHLGTPVETNNLLELLITNGANVNVRGDEGRTPLMDCSYHQDNSYIATSLLDHGAEIEAVNVDLRTPLMIACEYGRPNMTRLLVSRGAQVNKVDRNGRTAMMLAILDGYNTIEIIQILLGAGAEINIRDSEGKSALDHARDYGNEEVEQLLISNGAN